MYLLLRFVMLYCKDTGFQYYYKLCRSILSDYHQIRIFVCGIAGNVQGDSTLNRNG